MSKTLKKFLEVYEPKPGDEKKFKDKHITVKSKDPNGNGDDVFQATNVKVVDRQKEAHGYNPGADEKVYEEIEHLEEMDFRTAKELASKFKNKGDNRKASLYLKLADALKRGDKTTAQGFMGQIKGISEEQVDEMSDVQMKRREDIVKGMKKGMSGFKERYGKDAKSVMYATATKRAMGEKINELDEANKETKKDFMARQERLAAASAQTAKDPARLARLSKIPGYTAAMDLAKKTTQKEEVEEARDPNMAGVKVGEKVRLTNPKAPARHTLDKIKDNTAFVTKGDGSTLTTSLDRLKRVKAQSMRKEETDLSLLQLYMSLDEENQEILVQMLDEGRKDELLEFAQSISETVDGNDN